jgi:hypothetical protein
VIGLWRAICAIHPGRSIAKRAFDGGPVLVGPGLIDLLASAWRPQMLMPRRRGSQKTIPRARLLSIGFLEDLEVIGVVST